MAIRYFPKKLSQMADEGCEYISFELISKKDPEAFETIFLYLPPGISVPDAAQYNSVNLGLLGAGTALGDGTATLTTSDAIAKATSAAKSGGGTAGDTAAFSELNSGIAANPYTAVAFESTALRTFTFSFKLVSESADEAEDGRLIENTFRKFLYPKEIGSLALQYPPLFRIKFYSGEAENKFMPMILDSYLTTMNTVYNESTNIFHADGAPAEIGMELSFQETKNLTRDDLYGEDLNYRRDRPKSENNDQSGTEIGGG